MEVKEVVGYPFVGHVNQDDRPTMEVEDTIKSVYAGKYHSFLHSMLKSGYIKLMGYIYYFGPHLKRFVYKQHGSWHEAYAPNKTALRRVVRGAIDKIIELK